MGGQVPESIVRLEAIYLTMKFDYDAKQTTFKFEQAKSIGLLLLTTIFLSLQKSHFELSHKAKMTFLAIACVLSVGLATIVNIQQYTKVGASYRVVIRLLLLH